MKWSMFKEIIDKELSKNGVTDIELKCINVGGDILPVSNYMVITFDEDSITGVKELGIYD